MQHIDMMLEPLRGLLLQLGTFLPRLAIAIGVLVIGWLLAKAFRVGVVKALRALNFHVLTERAGIDSFLQQGGTEKDTTELVGWLAYALVILASLIVAFNGLGLTQVTDLLGRVLLFVPRLLVALLVIVFGSYFARFVGHAVQSYLRRADISDAELLGRVVQYGIATFVVFNGSVGPRPFLMKSSSPSSLNPATNALCTRSLPIRLTPVASFPWQAMHET